MTSREVGGEDPRGWAALDPLPSAVLVLDRELSCRYANPAMARWLLREDPAAVVGRSVEELLSPGVWAISRPYLQAALSGGRPVCFQRAATDDAGPARHAEVTVVPLLQDGEVVELLVQVLDTSARVQAEEELRRRAEAAAVERERDRVADAAAALISRPLFAASLELSATLQDAGADAGRVRASIEGIDAALAELRALAAGADVGGQGPGARPPGPERVPVDLATANAGDVIAVLDAAGRYEWVSPSSLLVGGWAPEQLVGRSVLELSHPDDAARLGAAWDELTRGAALGTVEYRRRRPDGSHHWVETRLRALRAPAGRLTGAVASIRDIEERRRLQHELAEALEVVELSFSAAPIGKALVSPEGRWLKVNPALAAIVGRSEEELLAGSYQDITHPADLDADLELLQEVLQGKRAGYEMHKRYLRPDGSAVWVQLDVAAAHDADGGVRFLIAQVQDISLRKAGEEALRHRADHDPLTGLWNRRRFTEELRASARDRRAADRQVLLLADLDGFKAVNDVHGHAVGDAHLRDVAAVLRATVRAGDACARLGGDEFAVLLHDADPGTATDIAGRIARRIGALRYGDGVSVGIAERGHHEDVDGWLEAADRAMYAVKTRPRR